MSYLSKTEFSPQRHRGHREKFLFVGRYRQTKIFCPKTSTCWASWTNTLPGPRSSGIGPWKTLCHEIDLRGSFRLSVSPLRGVGSPSRRPIDEKINLPLRALRDSVANLILREANFLRKQQWYQANSQWFRPMLDSSDVQCKGQTPITLPAYLTKRWGLA